MQATRQVLPRSSLPRASSQLYDSAVLRAAVRARAGAGGGALALSAKERRRHHDWALEMTFDDRDKAMDHAKASASTRLPAAVAIRQ